MRFWLVFFFMCATAFAHPGHTQPDPAAAVYKPTIGDYVEALSNIKKWTEGFDNPEFYKDLKISKKDELLPTSFPDLKDFDKNMIYLWQGERVSNQLLQLETYWQDELKKLPDEKKPGNLEKGKEPSAEVLKKEALRSDIEFYIETLHNVRKSHAVKFEEKAKAIFNKFKEIPVEDSSSYFKRITEWHDKQKLIDRNVK